jgi:hypothetical protein
MKKLSVALLLVAVAVLGTATGASAANPHFVKGPTVTDNGTTLTVTGSVAGLGNEDVRVVVTATGTAVVDCRNPGGNIAPGQRKTVDVSGEQVITDVKNGRINFNVTTVEPAAPADSCPNSQWTSILRDVEFTDADVAIYQPVDSTTPVLTRDVL